jgi:DNA-binding response OmpR family regulator
VRHVLQEHVGHKELTCAGRQIDLRGLKITGVAGDVHYLQTRDGDVLALLIQRAPQVVSRDDILDEIWGMDKFPSHRTVDNTIVRLREALSDAEGQLIRSVRGVGYQWTGGQSE